MLVLGVMLRLETISSEYGHNCPIPSLKLTYPLKIDPCKRRFLLETIIFRGPNVNNVSFRVSFLGSVSF